jgi:hypothetical protein
MRRVDSNLGHSVPNPPRSSWKADSNHGHFVPWFELPEIFATRELLVAK